MDKADSNLAKVLQFQSSNRPQLSGQLYKYINIVKGWQIRIFSVNAEAGLLSYFLSDSEDLSNPHLIGNSSPRGQYHLCAATVNPSDEDSRTFTINCASGEILKLRASDARGRQEWVDGLRAIVESHTQVDSSPLPVNEYLDAMHYFSGARQQLQQTELCNAALARAIENSPSPLGHTDPDFLTLKALSAANTTCLFQCLGLLQRHQEYLTDARSEQIASMS